ncbi:energy-coupling factor transporter transmembrane component T [Clostridium paridis]|uniref:Energy-coupling factor transporter transmembrane protein EcfT n=1 Tax=Clostridium paridis TaxID=2803863 RepID=A0A937K3L9_9CLOT|nr:energy-coupling factor transporter transmembrane component T [Clostridium paridis]MBL4932531.1 energy-coupling factor transporter transmembrane protein EcfT [Clostridium paridis]
MIEEWLLVKDSYVPKDEKNSYIEKSIFSLIRIIAIIRQNKNKDEIIYSINPTVKVIASILSVVLISITRSFIFLSIFDLYILITLFFMDSKERKRILLSSIVFPFITLVALIPSMLYGNIYNSLLLCQKIVTTIIITNLLSHNTKWSEISKSLKLLFIPDIFIWILEITIKYIVLLGEYSINLLYAFKLRSVGINNDKYNSISKIIGNLFLKSYKMSEEMSYAMECRGFIGEYNTPIKFNLGKFDYIYIIINILLFTVFIFQFITS